MAAGLLIVGAGCLVMAFVLVRLLRAASPVPRPAAAASPVRAAAHRGTAFHWLGLAAGGAIAVPLARWDSLGRGLMLAVPVAALVMLGAVAAGQTGLRSRRSGLRTASLEPRRAAGYLPRWLTRAVLAGLGWLLALLVVTTWAGAPDDLGRAGRSLASHGVDSASGLLCSSGRGPWPGSFYSVPMLLVVVAGLAVAVRALRVVALRPRLGSGGIDGEDDERLRHQAARVVVASVGVLVAVPALGVEATASAALTGGGCAIPAWWPVAGWGLAASALPTLLLLAWCLAQLLVPRTVDGAAHAAVGPPR